MLETTPVVLPVEGCPDLTAFRADIGFIRDAKALDSDYARFNSELAEGDLLISGWGANFELDREDEAFADGAFERGLKSFLAGESTLAYHHKHDHVLGRVLAAERVEGKGVRIVARVDNQGEASPLRHIYEQVKKGTLNALSCGGFFKRAMVGGAQRITDVDLTEWSITGVPVGRGCNFSVVGTKALTSEIELPKVPDLGDQEIRQSDVEALSYLIEEMNSVFARIGDSVEQRKVPEEEPAK